MMAIFPDMVEDIMKIFMDDFSVFGTSFDHCLHNIALVLQRCEDKKSCPKLGELSFHGSRRDHAWP